MANELSTFTRVHVQRADGRAREQGLGGGAGGLQPFRVKGRNGLQVLILVRGQPRTGAEDSGKAIGWNRPTRVDRSTS